MFRFHDIPAKSPQAAGVNASSFKNAKGDISWAWGRLTTSFPRLGLTPALFFTAGTIRLSKALFIDTRRGMPISACKSLLEVYIEVVLGQLQSKQYVGQLPQHHKRIAAEVMSVASSISSAQRRGYQFFADRRDFNKLIPEGWIKPWDEKGPDFLMSGPKGIAFLEIKGTTLPKDLAFGDFVANKAQSVNAELRPFGGRMPARYILSQVFAAPGEGLSVHWFNSDEPRDAELPPDEQAAIVIATALAQFVGQISIAGYDATSLLDGTFVLPQEASRGHGFVIAPQPDGEFTIGVSYAALRIYADISRFFLRLRAPKAEFGPRQRKRAMQLAQKVTNLRSFFGAPGAAWRLLDAKPIYTYPTGIFVIGPRDPIARK
jgi:hypothetical protein